MKRGVGALESVVDRPRAPLRKPSWRPQRPLAAGSPSAAGNHTGAGWPAGRSHQERRINPPNPPVYLLEFSHAVFLDSYLFMQI